LEEGGFLLTLYFKVLLKPVKMEKDFVVKGSIVREIWGSSDTVLLVFAGSAAEFALNRSVDWLYFTGR
jgi:hypothetical protein